MAIARRVHQSARSETEFSGLMRSAAALEALGIAARLRINEFRMTIAKSVYTPDNPPYRARVVPVTAELQIQPQPAANAGFEARMIDLVLNGVTSVHSRRSYKTGPDGILHLDQDGES
ncbi:MAG: hypothetical protein ACRYFU_20140 [Janthinobacterium lividum]